MQALLQQQAPGITVTDDTAEAAAAAAELEAEAASEEELDEMTNDEQLKAAATDAPVREEPMSKKERKRLKRAMAQEKATVMRGEEDAAETELEVWQSWHELPLLASGSRSLHGFHMQTPVVRCPLFTSALSVVCHV